MSSSNKHLKEKINEVGNFTKAHNNPPKDLYDSFLAELKVSKLYIPAIFEGEEINFEHLESDDGLKIIPVFTVPEEYEGDNELRQFEFSFYAEIIADCGFDGVVINPESDEFFVPEKFTDGLRVQPLPEFDEDEILDAQELKETASTVKNDELLEFICDESNFNNFDGLMEKLSGAVMLNVVSSREDLSQHARDGIINALEVGGFSLSIKSTPSERYGLLFTDADAIRKTCDTDAGLHYYYQVTSFDKILKYILEHEDYHIPRNVLLDIYENHPEIMYNPKCMDGKFYAFIL